MKLPPKILLILPGSVYFISYLYLAGYHGDVFLFDNPVHEGGTHTLLESIFYFSHFLAHVPVHTVLALFFVGTFLSLAGPDPDTTLQKRTRLLLVLIAALLIVSVVLSLVVFGQADTLSFVAQQKQGVDIYAPGGSWNLHLPSTVSLFFFIPVFLFVANRLFGPGNTANPSGRLHLLAGLSLFLMVTVLCNLGDLTATLSVWTDPRYLAPKPAFAEGGRLSIAYLLASHYFEHVLDSIYFTLLCLLLYGYAVGRRHNEPQSP